MSTLPWLHKNTKQWQKMLLSKKVPHAILLNGIKGLGKIILAKDMANIALCENLSEQGICYQCSACKLLKAGNHPDLTLIQAEKNTIKVEQIRTLSKSIRISSTKGQYRVVVIENAEKMNQAAANALLKTLEEPPAKVVILLTTSEMGQLLPTIKSRCLKINIVGPNSVDVTTWLKQQNSHLDEDILLAMVLAKNSPLIAQTILENDQLPQIKSMLMDLKLLSLQQKNVLSVAKDWISEDFSQYLPFIATYLLNLMMYQNHLIQENHASSVDLQLELTQAKNSEKNILTFVEQIHQFTYRSESALKKELLLEELLIHWKSYFKL
jgi:DNA polymerase-3 subunit delta'